MLSNVYVTTERELPRSSYIYIYLCVCVCVSFFALHIRLPFDEFTMRVLWLLNVAPTQLHPNSCAGLFVKCYFVPHGGRQLFL